ncbi:MAG: nitronate monooxygenase [Marinobacterium sp.]|nr:nitronate monooxygenase [Marinobacterium sp.]
MQSSPLLKRLGLAHPVIKAPMAGGIDSPELIAAVSQAGGMGFIGAAYLNAEQLEKDCQTIRQLTAAPFGINLFLPESASCPPTIKQQNNAVSALIPLHQSLNLPFPSPPTTPVLPFEAQFTAALNSGARALSFTFGIPDKALIEKTHRADMLVIGTATSAAEAQQLETAGVDVIMAQGSEAGGHRGGSSDSKPGLTSTLTLIPQIKTASKLPIIAAGGIMNGENIHTILQAGAEAAALGTAFIPCPESGACESWKKAIMDYQGAETTLTRAFSGRLARGIRNLAMTTLEQQANHILPFPWQNALTQPMRIQAKKLDNSDYLSLWAGQGIGQARQMSASTLMQTLIAELKSTKDRNQQPHQRDEA